MRMMASIMWAVVLAMLGLWLATVAYGAVAGMYVPVMRR